MSPGDGDQRGLTTGLRRLLPVVMLSALFFSVSMPVARADGTPTLGTTDTPIPTVVVSTPTLTVTPRPTPTTIPMPRPRPTATATTIAPRHEGRRKPKVHPTATAVPLQDVGPTATSTSATESPRRHKTRHKRKHTARAKPTVTPTATATATPAINLNAEDTISPVTCNGPSRPNAAKPFLQAPYHGWTSIVSFVDHDSPNFLHDGLITIATGASAQPDAAHTHTYFPAYWNGSLRQYLYYDGHNGYDFNLWYAPVYAAAAGKVIFARLEYQDAPDHGYGNMVMINHHHGYVTLYGHLSKILVKPGQVVKAGQRIGISGNTGHSTGPHLHFTVFHNCTPTDPYGWTGSGPDPLTSYQGESSNYLWKSQPLVDNPPPNWPGLNRLPGPPTERIVLLRLPATSAGTVAFTTALKRLANRDAAVLDARGLSVSIDTLRGAILVMGDAPPNVLYSLPGVASISSPGTVEGERQDVLSALAQAALVRQPKELALNPSHQWKGYLLTWGGHTFLIGTGTRGSEVLVRLSSGRGGATQRLHADAHTGAYAVDLGQLTPAQRKVLAQRLATAGRSDSTTVTNPTPLPRDISPRRVSANASPPATAMIVSASGLAAALLGLLGAALYLRRRRAGVTSTDTE